jgi:hypothetical protein
MVEGIASASLNIDLYAVCGTKIRSLKEVQTDGAGWKEYSLGTLARGVYLVALNSSEGRYVTAIVY